MRTISEMAGHLTPAEATIATKLFQRLTSRKMGNGRIWTLDLRHRSLGNLGRLTMYRPGQTGWPNVGQTTTDEETAKAWILERGGYAQFVTRRLSASANGVPENITVAAASALYLDHLEHTLGRAHNTFINRKSAFHRHINPHLGKTALIALGRKTVRDFCDKLTTRKNGKKVMAALRTKDNTRQALLALWRYTYPDEGCPYFGISLNAASNERARREQIIDGDIEGVMNVKSFDAVQIRDILLTAMWYDAHVLSRPCQGPRFTPLTAETLAMAFATGMRISEVMRERWKHILWSREAMLVAGIKNTNALRVIPLQRSLRPWLGTIVTKVAAPDGTVVPGDHVLQMRRGRSNRELYTPKQMIRRISDVMRLAGHKIDQKAAHACRSTYATTGKLNERLVDLVSLKTYLGHGAHGGATEQYVDRVHVDLIISKMPASHREFISLPTPDELQAQLSGFIPSGMKDGGFTMLKDWRAAGRPGGCP